MQIKYTLSEDKMPKAWYNIQADLPTPVPGVLNPATNQPITPTDLEPLFPMALIQQEVSTEPEIEIPEAVQSIYRQWRPTPLYRARRLEKHLDTPAKIYYKYEGVSPAGSHKPNTAVAQAYYNKEAGIKWLTTETGAGQWGSALAFAGALFDLEVVVYMVKVSAEQKPYRRALMETYGAKVIPSPSDETHAGRAILADNPQSTGSLGIAIGEAVEVALGNKTLISHLVELGLIETRAYPQLNCFAAGVMFARTEGILPAPEANHAVKGAIDEALRCQEEGISRTILFNLCGHGHFDMQSYIDYHAGLQPLEQIEFKSAIE